MLVQIQCYKILLVVIYQLKNLQIYVEKLLQSHNFVQINFIS